jgi:hypothetical protein
VSDGISGLTEHFAAPLEGVIIALGHGISEAQKELDRNSIATQAAIDADPQLSAYGIQATWYQFPKVDLQLKLAFSIAQNGAGGPAPVGGAVPPTAAGSAGFRLIAQPTNAAYLNHFNYDAQATSTMSLTIVPVPSPRPSSGGAGLPRLPAVDVRGIALKSGAKFVTVTDASGNVQPSPSLKFDITFNPAARLWYVLQYDPANPATKPIVVTVNDATSAVTIIST